MARPVSFRSLTVLLVATLVIGGACSSGGEGGADALPDTLPDAVLDVAPDPGSTDTPAEAPADTADAAGTPDPGPAEAVEIDWESLPRLPVDKTFSTRYAAGAGSADVTPDHAVPLGGFGFCAGSVEACRFSEGVHDPLRATAAALADTETGEVVVFVAVDSAGLLRPDIDTIHAAAQVALYEAHGVYVEGPRVVVSATHAHSSPDSTGLWGPNSNPRDEAYLAYLEGQVVAAVVQAYGDLQDARLDWARTTAPNSDEDSFGADDEVYVLRARTPSDGPIFVMTRWPAHPTCYGSENNGLSGDFVGAFRKRSEQDHGGVSVFLQGPIGSVYPDRTSVIPCGSEDLFPEGWQDPDVGDQDVKATCVGVNLANQVAAALQATQPVAETGLVARYTTFEFHPTNLAFMALAKIGQIAIPYVDVKDPESRMKSALSWITVGDLDFLTTPGEAFPSFAAKGAGLLTAAGRATPITLGLAQDWMGYLLTAEGWAEDNDETAYHKGLSPSDELEGPYLQAVQALIDR